MRERKSERERERGGGGRERGGEGGEGSLPVALKARRSECNASLVQSL